MKRIALIFAAAAAMVLGTNLVANAYPPGAATVAVSGTPTAGGTVTVTVTNCLAGEDVIFALPANGLSPITVACVAPASSGFVQAVQQSGTASTPMQLPNAAGTYPGTAQLVTSGVTLNWSVTVTANPTDVTIPKTGTDATGTMLWYAGGLLLIGVALFGVTQVRRRDSQPQAL